jgi:hypothetical protein
MELMKAYNTTAVKLTFVRRKPVPKKPFSVRRKPVSRQKADTVINPVSTPSLSDSLTINVSQAPEDRKLGRTSESTVEVSDALPSCDLPKDPSHPYLSQFSEESSAPKARSPWIAETDGDILEHVQTVPVQLPPVQSFISQDIQDKKRRRKKAIRNGIVLYITFISLA